MQNREPPGLPADETGAHTPYILFHRRTRSLCRATTHGYVRLFRYADDPSSERARGRKGGEKMERDASPSFLLGTSQRESRVCACGKGCSSPLSPPAQAETPPHFPPKKPPTLRIAEGAYCWPLLGICMSTHFSTGTNRVVVAPRIRITKLSPSLSTFECSFFRLRLFLMRLISSHRNLRKKLFTAF